MNDKPVSVHERVNWGKTRRAAILLSVLLVALGSVACGLVSVTRDLDIGLLLAVAAIAILVGWLMAASRLPGGVAAILAFLVGVVMLFLYVGRLEDELGTLLRALVSAPFQGGALVAAAFSELSNEVEVLVLRWGGWILALIDGNPTYDAASSKLVWGLGLWVVAVWAGWKLRLHQPVLSLIPAGVLLLVTLYWMRASTFSLLPLLGAILMLAALTWHDARERQWEDAGINFNRYIWGGAARIVATLTLALVLVAALVPTVTVQEISDVVERLTEEWENETASGSLGLEAQPDSGLGGAPFQDIRVVGLSRRQLLGSGAEASWGTVMIISVEDPRPVSAEGARQYYWRSATYDQYDGHGWSTSRTEVTDYDAGERASSAEMPFSLPIRQEVVSVGDLGGVLYTAGVLLASDRAYHVAWRSPGDPFGATTEATTYQADSLIPRVGEDQLRSAGRDYPQWVQNRYLTLPDDVPDRVTALAKRLTMEESTPYDQVRAIELYLRTFTYEREVPAPPFEQDAVDYFLFDLRRGYCGYYASSMAVLARAVGIPARYVVGYAGGTYDMEREHYIITEANAHAWVEVYFPGYGWVEFEPTASRPPIGRSTEPYDVEVPPLEPLPVLPEETPEPVAVGADEGNWAWWLALPGGLVILGVGGGALLPAIDRWRLRRAGAGAAVAVVYGRLRRYGWWLPVPLRAGYTPYEFARSFSGWIMGLARGRRLGKVLEAAAERVDRLTESYVRVSYGPVSPAADDQVQAVKTWYDLYWRLWLARLLGGRRKQ